MLKKSIKSILDQVPYVARMKNLLAMSEVPPGHYYSPVNNLDEVAKDSGRIWSESSSKLNGVKLRESSQIALLSDMKAYISEMPFSESSNELRYQFENRMFGYADGVLLYLMMRYFQPNRIIEVGSGYSSALMLDVNDVFFNGNIDLEFIEPNPERLNSLLRPHETVKLHQQRLQDVDVSLFEGLEVNDFLFVNSTHVSKAGSDVNYLFFEILPRIKPGVKIHIHDIFFPFEYPVDWILNRKRSWNENYILRSFLSFNDSFQVIAFNDFLIKRNRHWFEENMPIFLKDWLHFGSIWIERVQNGK